MAGLPCAVTLAHQAVSMVGGSPATSLRHTNGPQFVRIHKRDSPDTQAQMLVRTRCFHCAHGAEGPVLGATSRRADAARPSRLQGSRRRISPTPTSAQSCRQTRRWGSWSPSRAPLHMCRLYVSSRNHRLTLHSVLNLLHRHPAQVDPNAASQPGPPFIAGQSPHKQPELQSSQWGSRVASSLAPPRTRGVVDGGGCDDDAARNLRLRERPVKAAQVVPVAP
jgi:hypothetical protein